MMRTETLSDIQEYPKLIQPQEHKAKVCVWSDLTVDDVDRLRESENTDHIKQVLSDIFHLDDFKENLKTGVVMDLYFYTLQFAKENDFTKEKTSVFFSIVKKTHEVCIETPFGNLNETFKYFKELVLCHAVNRPPHSIELFTGDEVRKITEYVIHTYFRHFKMYKYAFTPLVRLDLSLNYPGMPPSPPQSTAGEQVDNDVDATEETDVQPTEEEKADDKDCKTAEPETGESDAKAQLRCMVTKYLNEEIKKIKSVVDEQIKSTEDTLNKKIEQTEGGSSGSKSGKGSAKGKKK